MSRSKPKELCPHCGASMMVNYYAMNKALVRSLYKLSKHPGKKAGDIGLTRVEYSVYTKLKWWRLIEPIEGEDGLWKVTITGTAFLSGIQKVPSKIGYFRNRLVESSPEVISIHEVFPTEESKQKYREMMTAYRTQYSGEKI